MTYIERAQDVAFVLNSDLPETYQTEIFNEELRVWKETLGENPDASRQILLVGAAGYIGTIVSRYLLDCGYSVRCMDALVYGNEDCVTHLLTDPNYEFFRGDFTNAEDCDAALEGVTDVVILGGLVGDPITKKYPTESNAINTEGMQSFINSLDGRGLNKVIFISTCSNYGKIAEGELADENFALTPLSLYAEAKVEAEKLLLSLKGKVDYTATILRFATAFGLSPRMRFDLTVNEFTRDLATGVELDVFDADTWRPYCHVEDFSVLIGRVLEAPIDRVAFEVFNAGGDENNYTKRMLIETMQKYLPDSKVTWQAEGPDPRNYRVNFAKVREALYFEPTVSVEQGIADIIAAVQQGFYTSVEKGDNRYGNYEIDYTTEQTAKAA